MDQVSNTVFFGSNAFFSLRVLDNLIELGKSPRAIVIPEFPGYLFDQKGPLLTQVTTSNDLINRAKSLNIETIFAPQQQADKLLHQLSGLVIDFILVACWPYKLSGEVYQLANKAAMNLHPSLLPKYRGANPVEKQINRGERNLGVSLHLLSDEFDSGKIVKQAKFKLSMEPDRESIEQQAADLGAELYIEASREFGSPYWRPVKQEIKHESKPDQ